MSKVDIKLSFCIFISFILSQNTFSQNISTEQVPRIVMQLNKNWRFNLGDVTGAQDIHFDDSNWELVKIPHDWAIGQQFDMNIDKQFVQVVEDGEETLRLRTGRTGALPMFGIGWYRTTINLPLSYEDRLVDIEFDGAMSNAQVYLNGNYIGHWPYGYTSFRFDLTPYCRFGEENILAVRLDNQEESSRWYTGAGLYRNVRLVVRHACSVTHWGTFIQTPIVNTKEAVASISTTIDKKAHGTKKLRLVTDVYDDTGKKVASSQQVKVVKDSLFTFVQDIKIEHPKLWDVHNPAMYTSVSNLYEEDILLDQYTTPFGIRKINFDPNKGFLLNNENMKIKGVCMHHDLGPLGAAVNESALERQLEMLKEMGCNAIRTSHNPPAPEFLSLCDRMGLLVQVEAFDEWQIGKGKNGYSKYFNEWCEKDIAAIIRRDRNHPSVFMWSIGNEVREQTQSEGYKVARRLVEACKREDLSRPITAGFNNHKHAIKNKLAHEVDLVGFNYKPQDYKEFHEKYPEMIIYGSETASTVSSRGIYKFPVAENGNVWYEDYQASSYDTDRVKWGSLPDTEFAAQENNDFILGEFVWTGFDYLGEPTPYNEGTPARSSYFGIIDLAGLKKDRFYLYQSLWSSTPVLHVLPHWNFPERIGQVVPVFCYTNYPKVELFVNGKSKGVKERASLRSNNHYRLQWDDVKYYPGEIKVLAYDENDVLVDERIVKTAGPSHSIKMTSDKHVIKKGGEELAFITVEVYDKDGNPCPTATDYIFFEVEGAGKIKALCNGDATCHTPFSSTSMNMFSGKMIVVIEPGDEKGRIKLSAYGSRLVPETILLDVE